MNAPNLPPRSASFPSPQLGHSRGSLPSALAGNKYGARNVSSSAVIADGCCSITSAVRGLKSRQKAASTESHSARPPDTSSSSSSSSAV